ncbi:hypothetical protein RMCBS344292_07945 [Rhizopus microsporus]|nr:hypothetical protein RMCBS344292_07945 [Rhizopus microsporus]
MNETTQEIAEERQVETTRHGMMSKAMNFISRLFPSPDLAHAQRPVLQTHARQSMHFDQVGTFYDLKGRGSTDEPRALRYLIDPTLRDTVANRYQQETTDLDIEERKALKRDFIAAHPSYDRALFIFSSNNPIRRFCQRIVPPSRGERTFGVPASRWISLSFSAFITACVVANVALRVLRLINLLGPAKDTFTAILFTGLPRLLESAALGLCLIVPFALYGKNVFMGLFYQCNDDSSTGKSDCLFENMLGTQEPMPEDTSIYLPRRWANPYDYNFDSFWRSLLILFEIASGEGWVDVMETSMGITGKDLSPEQDASQLWGIFFMVYNLAGSVFVISLFLGVVMENFTRRNGSAYLTSDQRRWLDLKKFLNQVRPAKRPKSPPTNKLRKWCFDLTVEKQGFFYKLMTVVVTLNIVFLCADNVSSSDPGSGDVTSWDNAKGNLK